VALLDARTGWAVVSEPFDSDCEGWEPVPPGSFCIFEGASVTILPFLADLSALAA
jgi:predicted glutamine amidotransferase